MPVVVKTVLIILLYLSDQYEFWMNSEGEMLLRTKPTTLFQISCESMLDPKAILKRIIGPDDAGTDISRHERVKML